MADEPIHTDTCPDCGGELVRESSRHSTIRTSVNREEHEETDHAWTIACAEGHIWNLTSRCNVSPHYKLEGRADAEAASHA